MLIEDAETFFRESFSEGDPEYVLGLQHVEEVVAWAKWLLNHYSQADRAVVLTAAWLHDVGRTTKDHSTDHAVQSAQITRRFLKRRLKQDTIANIVHCVRAHRVKEVVPKTLEAKIVAVADSISHMTGPVYILVGKELGWEFAFRKLDRDFRDLDLLPKIKKLFEDLYFPWKQLLGASDIVCAVRDKET
ncbi:MAG: HD domain-containing protein [Patescibacteria group bacterium]